MKLFIGCSSNSNIPEKYLEDCNNYLTDLFIENNDLVFGACKNGIMGLAYQQALQQGREITGICPEVYKDDFLELNCTKEVTTNRISERTDAVFAESEALIFLPGGLGTGYELLAALESKRNHEFDKPIIIYNSHHFFDELLNWWELQYREGLTPEKVRDCYYISDSAKDTLEYIYNYGKNDTHKRIKNKSKI